MGFAASILIALGLAMDAFAVSLGVATGGQVSDRRSKFRLSFHFGIFQMMMTILGWLAGNTIHNLIADFDHWVAMALLGYVGGNMIRSGLKMDRVCYRSNPSKGGILVMLSIATSLDALAVGLSMAILAVPVFVPAILIGVVTSALSAFGLLAGDRLGMKFGKQMEVLGGIILLGIGVRILASHLL